MLCFDLYGILVKAMASIMRKVLFTLVSALVSSAVVAFFVESDVHRIHVIHVVQIIHIFIVTHVNEIYLSLSMTPQPQIVPSRLNQNEHLTNSTTLPWVSYFCYMV